jgi:hypothetical protein
MAFVELLLADDVFLIVGFDKIFCCMLIACSCSPHERNSHIAASTNSIFIDPPLRVGVVCVSLVLNSPVLGQLEPAFEEISKSSTMFLHN